MSPIKFWLALFALLGVVIVAPAWVHFAGPATEGLPVQVQFLVGTTLPIMLALLLASWVGV